MFVFVIDTSLMMQTGLSLASLSVTMFVVAPDRRQTSGEAAGVNSATGSFGLSLGLACAGAIMPATLSIAFTAKAESSSR